MVALHCLYMRMGGDISAKHHPQGCLSRDCTNNEQGKWAYYIAYTLRGGGLLKNITHKNVCHHEKRCHHEQ